MLDGLARHYHRPLADQWDFVDYVQQQKLGLDLTTPPKPIPEVNHGRWCRTSEVPLLGRVGTI